eukprot:1150046-Pelagomonas_calceolata.AAC.5
MLARVIAPIHSYQIPLAGLWGASGGGGKEGVITETRSACSMHTLQVVLQGFLNVHISTWARRLITRSLAFCIQQFCSLYEPFDLAILFCSAAIVPAAILQYVWGDRATYKFLLIAQVALALQLPVTLVPMIKVGAPALNFSMKIQQ